MKIISALIERLNEENILYCHWKSNQHVSDAFTGVDDIDMLISKDDILELNIILNELGYKRFKLPAKRTYMGIEDYLGYDKEQMCFVHLHLHYELTLGEKHLKGYQLPFERSVLNRRLFDTENKIYISSHEDEMWLLIIRLAMKLRNRDYLKWIIGRNVIGVSTLREYDWLLEYMSSKVFKERTMELFGENISSKLVSISSSGLDFKVIRSLKRQIAREFKAYKAYSAFGATFTRWLRECFRVSQVLNNKLYKRPKIFRRSPISGGRLIALLGPDGAGKSTIIGIVTKKLSGVMDATGVYLGSGDGGSSLFRKPLKIIYNRMLKKGTLSRTSKRFNADGGVHHEGESKKAGAIRRLGALPWAISLSRERYRKILKAKRFRNNGYVVISDRYPQTQIPHACDGPKFLNTLNENSSLFNTLVCSAERKCFALAEKVKPDIVIILSVSPEVALERKPDEVDLETHKRLMDNILSLDFGENTTHVIVDANRELNEVISDVMERIWRCL